MEEEKRENPAEIEEKKAEEMESQENPEETAEATNPAEMPVKEEEEEDADDEDEEGLPFPKATIVNMLRKHLSPGKQIKGQVKREMNIWMGKMVERIADKMDSHPYTYVDGSMFREAIETYENIQDIEKERERIIKQLESVKAACDVLINEVDRKFRL